MKIFVVDDDPVARMMVVDQLGEQRYELREFADGIGLLAAMGEAPDLILLDIEMPGMSGVAACRVLREEGYDPQVIFISARDDLETRLAAYDAGGSDFILKPYAAEELAQKVRVAENALAQRSSLSLQANYAQQTAFTAMSSMGEMGVVLEFLRRSFACTQPAELAREVLDAVHQYKLPCLLQLRLHGNRHCYSSKGECTPLEASILDHTAGMERVFQFRDRLAVNYPGVTLLLLALPLDDPDRVGRLRDHLAILAEGTDARLQAMDGELRRVAQARGIGQAVFELTQALDDIGRHQAELRTEAMEVERHYQADLLQSCIQLGLQEEQEAVLVDLAQRAHAQLDRLRDDESSIGDKLQRIAEQFRRLAGH